MDTGNLKEHLNLLKIKDIKGLIRQYNLHYKIKLSQKKPELISDLLKHFEENIIDNSITSKTYEATLPKIEEPKPKALKKSKIKKDKEDKIKQPEQEDEDEGFSIKKEIEKSIRLFRGLDSNEWKISNTKIKAFYVKTLNFLEKVNKEMHKKVYNASPDLFKKYYDKNKNNQIVLGRGLELYN